MKNLILVCFAFLMQNIFAQGFEFPLLEPILFFDHSKNKLCVIEDSVHYSLMSLDGKRKERRSLYLDPQINFDDLKNQYKIVSEKGTTTFFVDRGCGYVLKMSGDSIIRIDNSFHHQNQFNGQYFLYQGRPYVFGGYGLYSNKDFLLRYDVLLKQWYLESHSEKYTTGEFAVFDHVNESFYCVVKDLAPSKKEVNRFVKYNFKTQLWSEMGKINPKAFPVNGSSFLVYSNTILERNRIYLYDFVKNEVNFYDISNTPAIKNIIYLGDTIVISNLTEINRKNHKTIISVFSMKEFNQKYWEGKQNIVNPKSTSAFGVSTVVFSIVLALIIALCIFFCTVKNNFKKEVIFASNFNLTEVTTQLLDFWVAKKALLLELTEVNDFVNTDRSSFDTVKKRRENLLKNFVFEISSRYGLGPHEVYTTHPHPTDKRMKMLKLNSKIKEKYPID